MNEIFKIFLCNTLLEKLLLFMRFFFQLENTGLFITVDFFCWNVNLFIQLHL